MSKVENDDGRGAARMVDVGAKPETRRCATASARVQMSHTTLDRITAHAMFKGDVLAVARVAGIMAAKRTAELIPLCHPLRLDSVAIDFATGESWVTVRAQASTCDRTGVEMEALTAASVAALTIYDMCKPIDCAITIEHVRLDEKDGGKSGHWSRTRTDGDQ